jgi:hypothetical protein
VKRAFAAAAALAASAALSACGQGDAPADPTAVAASKAAPRPVPKLAAGESGEVTPNAERIATIGLLNKRNNITRDLVIKVGEQQQVGNAVVRVQSCERTAPWEMPAETGAFVQFFVEEPPRPGADKIWRKVFSGWLFKNSPALNVVEHPIYDVWVKDCAMNFPGEEAKPASAASPSSAPKASGSATPAPAPAPSPSPAPRPADSPAGEPA